ncbi:serine/threonine protein kinase [bacterium]|nr:serine/threonine protein kinase [bacterium]
MQGPGDRIGGYRVLHVLGRGGMGVVYKAEDEATGRLVALKVILAEHARDDAFMKRFRVEARAAASIVHPHVTVLYQAGEHEGQPFLAFEHVPGGTLDRRILEKGPLPWREACERGAEVAGALAALHERGLVHRDLKPENVLLDEKGRAKLADFGLVRRDRGKWITMTTSLTSEGQILGTYAYMAPEQADGQKGIDGRADLYSLGAPIFAPPVGRPPFEGTPIEVLVKTLQQQPPSPRELAPDVPEALERLVLTLLAKDPAERPSTALVVAGELEALARSESASKARASSRRAAVAREPRARAEAPRSRASLSTVTRLIVGAFAVLGVAASCLFAVVVLGIGEGPPSVGESPKDPTPTTTLPAPRPDPLPSASELLRVARAKLDAKDLEGAIADGARAIELEPKNAAAWAICAEARRVKGDLDVAIRDASRGTALDPKLAAAWAERGAAWALKGDLDGAIADDERALAVATDARAAKIRTTLDELRRRASAVKPGEKLAASPPPDYAAIAEKLAPRVEVLLQDIEPLARERKLDALAPKFAELAALWSEVAAVPVEFLAASRVAAWNRRIREWKDVHDACTRKER